MKTQKGYKLFEQREDGKLFPLFIGKTEETPVKETTEESLEEDKK